MNIVIVESPAKAKTINQYLGKDYKVIASYGHIKDLPNKEGLVIPEEDFLIKFKENTKNKKAVAAIKGSVSNGDTLWLATDADREGEAISWHIESMLNKANKLENVEVKRVTFNEITKSAIKKAFKNPKEIDLDLVDAYQARRALDYLFGFTLSPVLWQTLPRTKSAGRVQSVALKLLAEREIAIEAFKKEEYWTIEAKLISNAAIEFIAELKVLAGKKLKKFDINTKTLADSTVKEIFESKLHVDSIEKKRTKRFPSKPFITSTLQQEASRKLGFSAKRTMSVAQNLYQGVDIKEESVGLITYMRTDSVSLSNAAISDCRKLILDRFGDEYLPETPNIYKNKNSHAQEAHEAIRPTNPLIHPEDISDQLDYDQNRLYDLIWKRTIASQMKNAEYDQVSTNINSLDNKIVLRASGSITVFDGFTKVYTEGIDDKKDDKEYDKTIPNVSKNEVITIVETNPLQHFTDPKPRFTEASLVKKLEELGIGRPSTYASIISRLQERGYMDYDKKRLIPTSRGRMLNAFLAAYFKHYIEDNFTADMEIRCDEIAKGKIQWKEVLKEWWLPFKTATDNTKSLRVKDVEEKIDNDLGPHFFPEISDGKNPRACPKCEDGKKNIRYGKNGGFIACSNYPECDYSAQLVVSGNDTSSNNDIIKLGLNEEGLDITIRTGRYGPYIQLGEKVNAENPKRVPIPKNIDIKNITLEQAKEYLLLPRNIGSHPETGKMITAAIGRFGPYVKHEKTFASIPKNEDVYEIGINRAVDLIVKKQLKPVNKFRRFTKKKYKKSSPN